MDWFNIYGLIIMAVIMIPNIIASLKSKDMYENKVVFWKESSVRKSLALSILPSVMFIFSGIITLNIPLIISSIIFALCHITISYKNAVL